MDVPQNRAPSDGLPTDSNDCDRAEDDSAQPLTGYQLVASLIRRQDEVIAELDALNLRVELAIQEVTEARKSDQAQRQGDDRPEIQNEPMQVPDAA